MQQSNSEEIFICSNAIPTNEENFQQKIDGIDDIIFKQFEEKYYQELEEETNKVNNASNNLTLEQAVIDYNINNVPEAFDFIYEHYKPKLERLAFKKKDEDLVQELSLALLNAIETFDIDGGAKFNTYFWKCAQNHMGTLKIRNNAKKRTAEFGTVSMQQQFSTNEAEVELGAFIEDEGAEYDYDRKLFNMFLDDNVYPYLKESEIRSIKMLLSGYTLEEIGEFLDGITAPAVFMKFRRLANKKHVGKQLKLLKEIFAY